MRAYLPTFFIFLFLIFNFHLRAQVQLGPDIPLDASNSGGHIAFSADKKFLAVSLPYYNLSPNARFIGKVNVYRWTGGLWAQVGESIIGETDMDNFGSSVDISDDGTRIAVGSTTGPLSRGRVKVFEWNGFEWTQMGTSLLGLRSGDYFGFYTGLSGDGNVLAISSIQYDVLSPSMLNDVGKVEVYEWDGNDWTQRGTEIVGTSAQGWTGESLHLSKDGDRLSFGTWYDTDTAGTRPVGSAKAYEWNGNDWAQLGQSIFGDSLSDFLGKQMALSADGSTMILRGSGSVKPYLEVHRYDSAQGNWVQLGTTFTTKPGDNLNDYLEISADGNTILYSGNNPAPYFLRKEWDGSRWNLKGDTIKAELPDSINYVFGGEVGLSEDGQLIGLFESYDAVPQGLPAKNAARVLMLDDTYQTIEGQLVYDQNGNCSNDASDIPMEGIEVRYFKGNETGYALTDQNGFYRLFVDTGTYVLRIDELDSPYKTVCDNSFQVSLPNPGDKATGNDFVAEDSILCPLLEVSIVSQRIRRCVNSQYVVSYCNRGTITAYNPVIEVMLDSNLSYHSSSIPLSSTGTGPLLQFTLDSIPAGSCGQFNLVVMGNCNPNLTLGDILCTSATILPDSLCSSELPYLTIQDSCAGDSLLFGITNKGMPFPGPLSFYLINDTAKLDSGYLNLARDEWKWLEFDGASTSFLQLLLAPENSTFTSASLPVSCNEQLTLRSVAFAPKLPQGSISYDCAPIIASYDPNDKAVTPKGLGEEHNIFGNQELSYTVRFQNIGNAPAYMVNIYDTLDQALDLSTLRIEAASHDYVLHYPGPSDNNQAVLQFEFNPIFLPDSASDELASNGFVKFSIRPHQNLPIGTRIENHAAIYFDYNPPIYTNTVFNTISLEAPEFAVSVGETPDDRQTVLVFPNPSEGLVNFELRETKKLVQLNVRDLQGRLIASQTYKSTNVGKLELPAQNGIYLLEIVADGEMLSHQLVVRE